MRNTTIGIILALVGAVAMAQSSGSVHIGDIGEDQTAMISIRSAPRDYWSVERLRSSMFYWTSTDTGRTNRKYDFCLFGDGDKGQLLELNASKRIVLMNLTSFIPVRGIREH